MRRRLVAGNWKMKLTRAEAENLVRALTQELPDSLESEVLVCPAFVYLQATAEIVAETPVALGAQNVSDEIEGAYTGEVSAGMLADIGCEYVLVGHSERRSLYGDNNEFVARKFVAASNAGLVPVLCVGETLDEHEAGGTEYVVRRQIEAVLKASGVEALQRAVIAYEPVWAIGTGRTATPEHAQDVHAFIRSLIAREDAKIADSLRILYGGSVKPANAADLFGMEDVDGGLIGGASLEAHSFLGICNAAG